MTTADPTPSDPGSPSIPMNKEPSSDHAYVADPALVIAAQVALELGQPLLLTGEPGTGKTTFANYLARHLAPSFLSQKSPLTLLKFETKSTSAATDLFYRFDSVGQFQTAHASAGKPLDNRDFISFEALGQAIIDTHRPADVAHLYPPSSESEAPDRQPHRSVVLIDEVDKAPRDFPNDLLNEIERHFFRIPELRGVGGRGTCRVEAVEGLWPIVLLTSNSERNLPAPFLRRCVFHHIRFPDKNESARLEDIIRANLGQHELTPLAKSAIGFFYDVRDLPLEKPPTSHELIQWIRILHSQRWFSPVDQQAWFRVDQLPFDKFSATLGVIAKTKEDLKRVTDLALKNHDKPTG